MRDIGEVGRPFTLIKPQEERYGLLDWKAQASSLGLKPASFYF